MAREKANAGHLTNFEVLDFLRTRGAKIDPMGCLGAVAASECKVVYEYLLKTPACNQTRESVTEFANRCEGFKLTDADKQNIINWRPASAADVYAMVEECGKRFCKDERGMAQDEEDRANELVALVDEVFPAPPANPEDEVDVDMKDV
ncbi:DNA-directed RNA polymerase III subunit RPC9 [Hordeum vulgare]|nr:DNA-directed RNA polymerase III subunit RPC9 [Hordeum vulgare]